MSRTRRRYPPAQNSNRSVRSAAYRLALMASAGLALGINAPACISAQSTTQRESDPQREPPAAADIQSRGEQLVRTMVEVNRHWLISPSPQVHNYTYEFTLAEDSPKRYEVENPASANATCRQGITYSTAIHRLVEDPAGVSFSEIQVGEDTVQLGFHFKKPLKIACGNGIGGSWYGYFSCRTEQGTLVLDSKRVVPLVLETDGARETFAQYVQIADGRYVPLSIRIDRGEMHFDWQFRVYEPGLWLFDRSRYGGSDETQVELVAWITNVTVNSSDAVAAEVPEADVVAAAIAKERSIERSLSEGRAKAEALIAANRAWLVPPLAPRRGLVYEYRQEPPYVERVMFGADGNIMAQLQSSKGSPDKPTRQRLYHPDGTSVIASFGEPYVKEERVVGPAGMTGEALLHRERAVNELAVGLALDCALTRLARDPSTFTATVESAENGETYRLLLKAPRRARIFAGTMLAFTSWAYMHDVGYARSEIVVDAAAERPIEERDYDHAGNPVASFTFSDYLDNPGGAAPGRIRAVVPYEKDGADHTLEMDARFAFVRPDVWLLQLCRSEFRGGQGASTGEITIQPTTPESFVPVEELRARLEATRETIARTNAAPTGRIVIPFKTGEPIPAWTKAAWTETSGTPEGSTVIAIKEAGIEKSSDGAHPLMLTLISTAYWTEYETRITAELRDADDHPLGQETFTVRVRAEGSPSLVNAECQLPAPADGGDASSVPQRLVLTATVERMTASYHGHGLWMTFLGAPRGDEPD